MIGQLFQASLPSIEHFHSLAYWVAFVVTFAETALVVGLLARISHRSAERSRRALDSQGFIRLSEITVSISE